MIDHIFTEMEASLLLELLESESKRLSTESRRATVAQARNELRNRERTVDRLIERLHEIKAGDLST